MAANVEKTYNMKRELEDAEITIHKHVISDNDLGISIHFLKL